MGDLLLHLDYIRYNKAGPLAKSGFFYLKIILLLNRQR